MKVFVVVANEVANNELIGTEILEVFDSFEKASIFCEKISKKESFNNYFDIHYDIEEFIIK